MVKYSSDIRISALRKLHAAGPKYRKSIAEECGIGLSTLMLWKKQLNRNGQLFPKTSRKKKKQLMHPYDFEFLVEILEVRPFLSSGNC
jgi:transposase